MFLLPGSFRATKRILNGVQYNVFSFYSGEPLLFDRIGGLIENALNATDADVFAKQSFTENGIAIDESPEYNVPVTQSLRERSSDDYEAG